MHTYADLYACPFHKSRLRKLLVEPIPNAVRMHKLLKPSFTHPQALHRQTAHAHIHIHTCTHYTCMLLTHCSL